MMPSWPWVHGHWVWMRLNGRWWVWWSRKSKSKQYENRLSKYDRSHYHLLDFCFQMSLLLLMLLLVTTSCWCGLDRYTHEHLYQLHWQQWRQPSIVYFIALLPHRTLNISGIYLGSWCGTILYDDAMVNMESLCPSPKCIYTSAHCNLLSSLQSWRHSNIKYHCRLWYLLLFFWWI